MKKLIYKIIVANLVLIISLAMFGDHAEAQSRRTSRIRYDEEDSGRSRVRTSRNSEIRRLEGENKVEDLKIPILFGVALRNLYDSWGDARSGGRTHEGIDILAPRGEFVISPTEAVVTTVDTGGNGGKHVFTTNPGGERFYFAHLDAFAEGISEGDILKEGDLIGYVGNTGNAAGGVTHLHFGIYGDDRDTENPFPRLTREFSSDEKAEAFIKILNSSDDKEELAQSVVNQNKDVFIEALALGVKLPATITDILIGKRADVLNISRVLRSGMTGDDVKALQAAIGVTADGEFGPRTKAALVAFQVKSGISATGILDVTTKLMLGNSSLATTVLPTGCTSTTAFSPVTGAKCVPTIAVPLPAGCTATSAYSVTTGKKCPVI